MRPTERNGTAPDYKRDDSGFALVGRNKARRWAPPLNTQYFEKWRLSGKDALPLPTVLYVGYSVKQKKIEHIIIKFT